MTDNSKTATGTHRPHFWISLRFCLLSIILVLAGCQMQDEITLYLEDSRSGAPVAGALVYYEDSPTVYRSNIHGAVSLPAGGTKGPINIHAKNYRPVQVAASDGQGPIVLKYDERLVNPREMAMTFTRADTLRGSYGPFRENNDLLFYALSVRVEPERKYLSGSTLIRFRMLDDGDRIQVDLFENMDIDSILFEGRQLEYERDFNAVFVDFPRTLRQGETHAIDFHYSGFPVQTGRFGGLAFREDSLGNHWINTANQGIGASIWWPNKDQQRDEVDSMTISVAVPSDLMDVSNGRFMGKTDLGDGFTRYDWKVHYPINNYSVSLNIGKYVQFSEMHGDLTLDYYVLPYHLAQARRQFAQAKPMIVCFEKYFGPYPFPKDGFKLVEVPYSGMEHQSAVTYGNLFRNGYLGRDWTGVGISTKFDFIIIHESGHEWFGNAVTAQDVSDAWIQEGWCTYAEGVYVECMFGYDDAVRYFNGYKNKVRNRQPIIGPTAVNKWPPGDQYFKGALFLNTLRNVVDDDDKWWALIKDYTADFSYRNIWTTDVINYFNDYLDRDLRPVFEQYLYYWKLPVLQYRIAGGSVSFRWQADVTDFDMPVKVMTQAGSQFIYPTSEWQSENLVGDAADWQVDTDHFYVDTADVGAASE